MPQIPTVSFRTILNFSNFHFLWKPKSKKHVIWDLSAIIGPLMPADKRMSFCWSDALVITTYVKLMLKSYNFSWVFQRNVRYSVTFPWLESCNEVFWISEDETWSCCVTAKPISLARLAWWVDSFLEFVSNSAVLCVLLCGWGSESDTQAPTQPSPAYVFVCVCWCVCVFVLPPECVSVCALSVCKCVQLRGHL